MLNKKSGIATLLLLATLTACGGNPAKESTGEFIDDTTITTKVKAAFVSSKEVKAGNIQVETFKGNVQLSGFADNHTEIERAAQIAAKVAGVKSVRNDIRLKAAQ
jgi:osmotically-inducible protein OsmY